MRPPVEQSLPLSSPVRRPHSDGAETEPILSRYGGKPYDLDTTQCNGILEYFTVLDQRPPQRCTPVLSLEILVPHPL